MKTIKKINVGVRVPNPKNGGFNLLAIDHNGSPTTTQVWDGNVCTRLLEWIKAGMTEGNWNGEPLVRAYIHSCRTGETYEFDLTNPAHVALLK